MRVFSETLDTRLHGFLMLRTLYKAPKPTPITKARKIQDGSSD